MKSYKASHMIEADPDTVMKLFLDEEFNRAFYVDSLGLRSYRVLELCGQPDGTIRRRVEAMSDWHLPAFARHLVPDAPPVIEDGVWDPSTFSYSADFRPLTQVDSVKQEVRLKMRLIPKGDKQTIREIDYSVSVSAFGLGSLVEQVYVRGVRTTIEPAVQFMNQWIRDHRL